MTDQFYTSSITAFDAAMLEHLLRQEDALLSGHFRLSSGLHSDTYVQCARFLRRPDLAAPAAAALAVQLEAAGLKPDVVVGPAMGGVVIGYELARQLRVPGIFTERDADGQMTLRRGFTIEPGSSPSCVLGPTGFLPSEIGKWPMISPARSSISRRSDL